MRLLLDRQHAGTRILLVAGLVAVGLTWAKVASTIHGAKPTVAPGQPSAIVWAGRVFGSRDALRSWLSHRGVQYTAWRAAHPAASAILQHRSAQAPRPDARTPSAQATAATSRPPGTASALATARAASASGRSAAGTAVLALLALVAAICAAAAWLPAPVLYRYPALGRRVGPRRDLLLAGAAAIGVGIAIGVALT